MIAVSNTTPLIALASIQRFHLLQRIFEEVFIPQAVYYEVMAAGKDRTKREGITEITSATWIKAIPVNDRIAVEVLLDDLDLGESETIVLARELNTDWVVMDEKKGRRKLDQLGFHKIGTVGVLLRAKELKLISSVRLDLEQLHKKGFSLSQSVIELAVRQAGE